MFPFFNKADILILSGIMSVGYYAQRSIEKLEAIEKSLQKFTIQMEQKSAAIDSLNYTVMALDQKTNGALTATAATSQLEPYKVIAGIGLFALLVFINIYFSGGGGSSDAVGTGAILNDSVSAQTTILKNVIIECTKESTSPILKVLEGQTNALNTAMDKLIILKQLAEHVEKHGVLLNDGFDNMNSSVLDASIELASSQALAAIGEITLKLNN